MEKIIIVKIYKYLLKQFNFLHDCSAAGSAGQIQFLFFHFIIPPAVINVPETINNKTLYFSNKSNFGKAENIDANIGPPPNNNKNAGKAQHINVDVEAKSVNKPSFDDSCLLIM